MNSPLGKHVYRLIGAFVVFLVLSELFDVIFAGDPILITQQEVLIAAVVAVAIAVWKARLAKRLSHRKDR